MSECIITASLMKDGKVEITRVERGDFQGYPVLRDKSSCDFEKTKEAIEFLIRNPSDSIRPYTDIKINLPEDPRFDWGSLV